MDKVIIPTVDESREMRLLVHRAQFAPDERDRDEAKARLRELAAEWRGFPGQRRRGDPPAGVNLR